MLWTQRLRGNSEQFQLYFRKLCICLFIYTERLDFFIFSFKIHQFNYTFKIHSNSETDCHVASILFLIVWKIFLGNIRKLHSQVAVFRFRVAAQTDYFSSKKTLTTLTKMLYFFNSRPITATFKNKSLLIYLD